MSTKLLVAAWLGLVIGLSFPFLVRYQEVQGQQETKKPQWEYRIDGSQFGVNVDPTGTFFPLLNGLGNDGWEYVGPLHAQEPQKGVTKLYVVCKRLKK